MSNATVTTLPGDLIKAASAAKILGVHVGTVYRLVRTGKLRAWKRLGQHVRVSRADVEALMVPVEVGAAREVMRGPTHEEEASRAAVERLKAKGY